MAHPLDAESEARPAGWAQAPRLEAGDLVALIWRERGWAIGIGLVIVAFGAALALLQPRYYEAESRVFVRLGQEYVFSPKVGGAGAGATPKTEEVVNGEMRLIGSPEVVRRTLKELGAEKVFPDLASVPAGDRRNDAAERAFTKALTVSAAPDTPIIGLRLKHRDPAMAAKALNLYVRTYLAFRREVLVDPRASAYVEQGDAFQARLAAANADLATFLAANKIGDFDSEKRGMSDVLSKIDGDMMSARAEREAVEGQAQALRARVGGQASQIDLFSESDAQKTLVDLQIQRAQLIARYAETAPPVVEVDRRIREVQTYLAGGPRPGLVRRGPNPVRQELETQLFQLEAQAKALSEREKALKANRETAQERLQFLMRLEPRYLELARARAILEENARNFGSRAEEARAFQALAGQSSDNISVMEEATPPVRGSSLRLPIALASLLLAALLGLAAALLRGLLRDRFPTPQAAARTLGAPVLGVIARTPRGARA
jgi:uncharacterized protein involved in exopolysaccharide biosynthesis